MCRTLGLPKESYSNKQWQLKLHQRRCRVCITNKHVAQLTTPKCWYAKKMNLKNGIVYNTVTVNVQR